MMITNSYQQLLGAAKTALRNGNKELSKDLALKIILEHPGEVEGWLLMGSLSNSKTSLAYMLKAQDLAPEDPRVAKALAWAETRFKRETQDNFPPESLLEVKQIENGVRHVKSSSLSGKTKSENKTTTNISTETTPNRSGRYQPALKTNSEIKQRKVNFLWLTLPLVIFLIFGFALYIERMGPSFESKQPSLTFLEKLDITDVSPPAEEDEINCLLLFDSVGIEGSSTSETARYTLESMRVKYRIVDVSQDMVSTFDEYDTIVISFIDLTKINQQIFELIEWVENGGRLLFTIRPDPSATFSAIYRKLGINSKYDNFQIVTGLIFLDDLLPGAKAISLDENFMSHNSLIVVLSDQSRVHITSADRYQLPILWEYNLGEGRIVVFNTDQFITKETRGILAAGYSLLEDVSVYPVINSSIFFIDDFPAPIPEGENTLITQEFNRDLQSFYINVWWPDMQHLARKYGIKYTGVVIETYSIDVEPPFEPQSNVDLFIYFGSSLLQDGGEIGYHGYNHVPLCLENSECDHQLNYPYWLSEDAMFLSLKKLNDFISALFGDEPFSTYVPPSNILSSLARNKMPEVLPELKVIASVYHPDLEDIPYVQEFEEADDGIVELPRITSGFQPDDFMRWSALNELNMHYVQAHFVHPDDVLDEVRGQGSTWTFLRDKIEEHFLWLNNAAPSIRHMTAREGAMAVQRYARLGVESEFDQGTYHIYLDNFYDEAWLLMRSKFLPANIDGGLIEVVGTDLYLIEATNSEVIINFEE